MPPENRVGCDDRGDVTKAATAKPMSMHGQPTAFLIGQADQAPANNSLSISECS
jgi:hypothetical protein